MGYRIHWEGLSNSSRRAFEWAAIRSETRPDDPSINAIDLLVGVLKLHRGQSEFYQLFDHLGLAVEPFLANFKVDGQPGIDDLDQISKPLSDFPKYDSEVGLIVERSFGLTDEFNPETDRVVRLRDLFGGIFTTENEASKRLKGALTSAPIAYSDLVASYPQYLSYDSHEIKYDQFLNQHHRYSAYSGYDSDSRADQDLIGIGPEVNGFAYLISSKNLKPPLAIGLFGDWGSGKSYFMEQLRKRIYKITNDVRDSGEPQSDIDIYKSIVQIEFNAWHYVEGELWASLVEHIFSNLQMTSEDKVTLLQQRKKHWLERLGSAQALAEQVKERKETLEIELAEQRAEMDRLTAERLRQLQTLEDLKTRGALGLVKRNDRELDEALEKLKENETFTHLLTALTEMDNTPANSVLRSSLATAADSDDKAMAKEALKQLAHSDLYPALKKNLDDEQEEADLGIAVEALKLNETFDQLQLTLNDLGITETYTDALEMVKAFQELHQTLQRGNLLVNSIQRRGWPWTLALIGVVLIGPTLSLLLALLPARIPAVSNVMTSIGAFLAALTLSIKSGTHWLSTSLDKIEAAETRLEDLRQAAEDEYAQRLAHLERQYAQKEAEYDQAKLQEEAIILQIAEIQRELQGLTPGSVLLDFIEERVGSDDYRKHLGVAALIRRDFDQLWQLIDEHNKDLEEKDEVGKWSEEERPFSRIVLYIDDLDRCPPDRVVEVLQAVHLLLAFPLFVVVVAVDARWLAQSLQKHYTDLLVIARHSPNVQLATNLVRQATPQDYLEKIFQIPFWIRPLPREARLRMVQGLLAKKIDLEKGQEEGNGNDKSGEKTTIDWREGSPAWPVRPDFKTDPKPRSLEITTIEQNFMNDICNLLGDTPRSVKRFVNVYRLIKAVALPYSPNFVDEIPFADFKLVLFLLAIVTGMTSISQTFFLLLRRSQALPSTSAAGGNSQRSVQAQAIDLWGLLENLRHILRVNEQESLLGQDEDFVSSEAAADTSNQDKNTTTITNDKNNFLAYGDIEANRDFDRLQQWVKDYEGGLWKKLPLTSLADWIPQVARFSYRIEEV